MTSSFVPPLYNKFGKGVEDLLTKKFASKKELKVKTAADAGRLVFESGINFNEKSGAYGGSLKVTQTVADIGVAEAEFDTTGKFKGSLEADKLAKGAVVKIAATEKPSGSVTVNYKQENFSAVSSIDITASSTVVSEAVVVGVDGLSVGGHVDYNMTAQNVVNYNAGAEYSQRDFTATVQTQDTAEQIVASYIHSVRPGMNVGARFHYNLGNGARVVTLAADWATDANTLVKARVSSNGEVQAALEQRLRNPALLFGLSTKFDANAKSTAPQEFGLSFTFGDE